MKRLMATWVPIWLLGGALGGAILALGEEGHLPRPLLPPLLAIAGALCGGVGALIRRGLPYRASSGTGPRTGLETGVSAGIGMLLGVASWYLGLGLPATVAVGYGAVLGGLSGAVCGIAAGRRD